MDLFGDLPEPTQSACAVTPAASKSAEEKEDNNLKRKRADLDHGPSEDRGAEEIKKVCREGLPVLKGYVASRRGEREEMQDAHVLMPDMTSCLTTDLSALPSQVSCMSYFAVFDGHGGARASCFAAEHLHHTLAKKFPRIPTGETENLDKLIKKCLLDTFRQTDEDFLKKASSQKPAWKDGTTATCLLAVDDMVYVANLGDSRAVLCRMELEGAEGERRSVTLALSKEHNPTIYEERMRIQRAGGTVRDGRILGVLEVSRSIGDGQYKRCGVISTPDIRRCQLTTNDRFIILACDGLFKVFSADEAVKYVLGVLQEEPVEKREGLTEEAARYEAASQRLASEAVRRGCADNVTVILVSIGF